MGHIVRGQGMIGNVLGEVIMIVAPYSYTTKQLPENGAAVMTRAYSPYQRREAQQELQWQS